MDRLVSINVKAEDAMLISNVSASLRGTAVENELRRSTIESLVEIFPELDPKKPNQEAAHNLIQTGETRTLELSRQQLRAWRDCLLDGAKGASGNDYTNIFETAKALNISKAFLSELDFKSQGELEGELDNENMELDK